MLQDLAQIVLARCDALAAFSEEPDRLTRPSLSPAMRQAHAAVAGWMRAADMLVREDQAANNHIIICHITIRSSAMPL